MEISIEIMDIYGVIPILLQCQYVQNVSACPTFAQFFWYIWHANVKLEIQYFDKIVNIYYWEKKTMTSRNFLNDIFLFAKKSPIGYYNGIKICL